TKLVEKVVVQKPRLKPGSYVVRIILRHKNGDVTRLQRTIHVEQAGVIVVNVSS
ncbi:MAG: hypothetical protein HY698_18950, partial [Deltaproteobacteria bacterium]|nr:hypothetical protein [Deltaproteobacteria bacterium]